MKLVDLKPGDMLYGHGELWLTLNVVNVGRRMTYTFLYSSVYHAMRLITRSYDRDQASSSLQLLRHEATA